MEAPGCRVEKNANEKGVVENRRSSISFKHCTVLGQTSVNFGCFTPVPKCANDKDTMV